MTNHRRTISSLIDRANFEKGEEIGIEIECEGHNLVEELLTYWKCMKDGSLRGENQEYVLRRPVAREGVAKVLNYLNKKLEVHGSELARSDRTSVHIHINCLPLKIKQVYNFICLYLIFEELLVGYCNKSRECNLFCLRARDAEFLITMLKKACLTDNYWLLRTDQLRYAAMNVSALFKFGSLEFRALQGTVDPNIIQTWVALLLCLKDKAIEYDAPGEILYEFSRRGADGFLGDTFGELRGVITKGDVNQSMYEGARLAQDIAFARDWE